jgi:hypothetical protein
VEAVLLCLLVFLGVNEAWLLLYAVSPAGAPRAAAGGTGSDPAAEVTGAG